MKKLLAIEWMKVKSYRTFWVLIALFIGAVIGLNYISFYINSEFNDTGMAIVNGTPYGFPEIWNTVAWMSSWLLYFPGFVMILIISNEYTYKTHRQNVIDGLSRKQFVFTKFYVAFILALFTVAVVFITAIIFGLAGGDHFSFSGIQVLANFFLCSWAYILFALMLAFLVRRAVLAIGIFFIFGLIVDNVVPGLLMKPFDGKPYGTYIMPLDVADKLLTFPFLRSVSSFLESPKFYACLVLTLAWITFYHFFTNRKFQGEDL